MNQSDLGLYGLLPGYFQGITRVTISYPFDSIKVQLQKHNFSSILSVLKHSYHFDKKLLYRGSSLAYTIVPLDRAIQFYIVEKVKHKYNHFISGLGVGLITNIYNVPMQKITTNAVLMNKNDYKGLFQFCSYLIKKQPTFLSGILSLYKGNSVEITRTTLGSGIFLGVYNTCKDINSKYNSSVLSGLYGIISSISSWIIIYPLDTIRVDKQTTNQTYSFIIKNRYKTYGLFDFYKGITPVLLRSIPSSFCGMLVYDIVLNAIK
jgi:hypothetical protein